MTNSDQSYVVTVDPAACSTCGHFACVCAVSKGHAEGCKLRVATTCTVPIECEHGRDVCPVCDPCTCGADNDRPDRPQALNTMVSR